jgi:hypothetical protein
VPIKQFGLLLMALSAAMLFAALPARRGPRRGEVVWFLRDRDGLQMLYVTTIVCLFLGGVVTFAFLG